MTEVTLKNGPSPVTMDLYLPYKEFRAHGEGNLHPLKGYPFRIRVTAKGFVTWDHVWFEFQHAISFEDVSP